MAVAQETIEFGRADARLAAPARAGRLPWPATLALVAPAALLLLLVFYLPIGSFLLRSVSEPHWTLAHYARLLHEPLYARIFLRTLWIAGATTAIALVLGYPIALLMARSKGWIATLVAVCVLLPLWTSVLVRSYAWIVLLQRNGIINNALKDLGLIDAPLRLIHTEGAVLLAMSHVLMPFIVLPLYATLRNVPHDLTQAALNLGAGRLRSFCEVTLPLSLPGVAAGSLMIFVLSLGFYVTPALVGGPRNLMIATLISQQATESLDWPFASAIACVLLVLSVGTTIAMRRLLGVGLGAAHG